MEKKLRRYTQEELQRAYPAAASEIVVGAKGTESNPYSKNEYEDLFDKGQWSGGYVEGEGYIPAATDTVLDEAVVTTSRPSGSGSGSGSDLFCNTHDKPYITEGSETFCSDCRRENSSYGSGSGSGGGLPVITGGTGGKGDDTEIKERPIDPNNPKSIKVKGNLADWKAVKSVLDTLPKTFVDYINTLGVTVEIDPDMELPENTTDGATFTDSTNTISLRSNKSAHLIYHELIHAMQENLHIDGDSGTHLGLSNLEFEAFVMNEFIRRLYRTEDPCLIPTFEKDQSLSTEIGGLIEATQLDEGVFDNSDITRTLQPHYEAFLTYYQSPEHRHEKYGDYNKPTWNWNWKVYFEKLGLKIRE